MLVATTTSRRRLGAQVSAALAYAGLTVALTWPLVLHLGTRVPNDLGDPLLSMWTLWWNAQVLPFTARWWDGLAFFPAAQTLSFSDHRVGLGLIATPAMWLGASPVTAHNVVFLSTFFLSALAAHALCFSLTRSMSAAVIGGLVFGFNPFRAGHLSHLELLASYWLPISLLALHQWSETQRRMWLVLLAFASLMQALTSGYYFFYSGVLIAMWLAWFLSRRVPLRQYVELGLAFLAPLLAITPILVEYRRAHHAMGLSRGIAEIERLSADAIGLLTAPGLLAVWNSPEAWHGPEGALMPGLTAVVIVAMALLLGHRSSVERPSIWMKWARAALLAGAGVASAVALIPWLVGPVRHEVAGLRVSISDAYKPLSFCLLLLVGWLFTTSPVRRAWATRSPFAFYVLATVAMWLFAMGPTIRLLGQRVIYKAPYAWLMLLPGFRDEFRAPARFAMLAALTLSVAAALAYWRLVGARSAPVRLATACLVGVAILTDSWLEPLPLIPAPPPLAIPAGVAEDAVVLEWPIGVEDATAVYHSMSHRRRTVNGMSGYAPPHYMILSRALAEGRLDVLGGLTGHADVALFVPRGQPGDSATLLATRGIATPAATTDTHEVLYLSGTSSAPPSALPHGNSIAVQRVAASSGEGDLDRMSDGDRRTAWVTSGPQRGNEQIVAELGDVHDVAGIVLALGPRTWAFPRRIVVALSADGVEWIDVWTGDTAALSLAAAIADPLDVRVPFSFAPRLARYIRISQVAESQDPWAVAELQVLEPAPLSKDRAK